MRTPPDLQVSSILAFLAACLRSDKYIAKWTEASPEQIVSHVAEFQPIDRGPDGKLSLYQQELPALCLHIVNERFRPVPGSRPPTGREFTAWLWYLFQPFQGDSADVHGYTKGGRLCTLMWWRIQHYLYKHGLYTLAAGADDPTWDLQDISKIRLLEFDGSSDRVQFDAVEGLRIPIKVWHGYSPYPEDALPTFDLLDWKLYTFDPDTLAEQLKVEGDFDQT